MSQSRSGPSRALKQNNLAKRSNTKSLAAIGVIIVVVTTFSFWYCSQSTDPGIALYNQGMSYLASGDTANAEKSFVQGTKEDPRYAPCFNQLGAIYVSAHRFDEARAVYLHASKLDPKNGNMWLVLGSLYAKANQLDAAAKAGKRAADLLPNDADAQAQYGLIEDRLGKGDEAYSYYRKAHDLRPSSPEFLITMCRFSLAQPFSTEQINYQEQELAKYLQANPTDVDAAEVMVQTEERQPPTPQRLGNGVRYANQVLAARPADLPVQLSLAQLYLSSNHVTDALRTYQIAQHSHPKSKDVLHGLVVCYTRLGKTDQAADVAKTLAQLQTGPTSPTTTSHKP